MICPRCNHEMLYTEGEGKFGELQPYARYDCLNCGHAVMEHEDGFEHPGEGLGNTW